MLVNCLIIAGLLGFTALMWFLAKKFDEQTDREADINTQIERERHDAQTPILKHGRKRGSE